MNIESERAAFEAELQILGFTRKGLATLRCGGEYINEKVQECWIARQARAKLAAPAGVVEAVQIKGTGEWHLCRLNDRVWSPINDLRFRSKGKAEWWLANNASGIAAPAPVPTVEPAHSDDVSVPRELVCRIMNVYAVGLSMDQEIDELRTLLNGGRS